MEKSLQQKVAAGTSSYGQAFEHFIICEVFRLNGYFRLDYDLSHYQTSAGGELGLVLSRNRKTIAIEIKSTDSIDPVESKIDGVHCLPWQKFFEILPEI